MRIPAVLFILSLPLAAQVTSQMNSPLDKYAAPWVGTKDYIKRNFLHNDKSVTLQPPVKLKDYMVDGKLRLSLRAYFDLVLANNTDIGIQRLNLELPKNSIERALAVFDPSLTASYSATRSVSPATNQLQGADIVSRLTQPFQTRFTQLTPYSTSFFSTLNIDRGSTNDQYQFYNPALTPTITMGFTQPLVRGRGQYITKLGITIAKTQKRSQDFGFYDQILRLMVTAENAYWDVVSARERIRVQAEALKLAEAALTRTRREVELGATSPLEIFQPEQNAASARISLTQVEFQLEQALDVLRRQIGADLEPGFRTLPIELTENVNPGDNGPLDKEKLVELAMGARPDLKTLKVNLEVNDLQIDSALNGLRPLLNFQGTYSTTGRGGTVNLRPGQPGYPAGGTGIVSIPGGLGDGFRQWFDYSTYAFSLTLNLPLRDRSAAATLADSVVNKKLNTMRLRNTEQQIRQEVLNAVTQVESSRQNVKLAEIAVDFARKRADADQKRYDLGVINVFFLLSAQNDLTVAESQLVNAQVTYRRNLLTMQQRLGTLLDNKGIVLSIN